MVQKSKGGKKSRSVVSGKRKKNDMKHHRKTKIKTREETKIECCVCYEEVFDRTDNTIMCGQTKHPLCGDCKIKVNEMGGDCPMCRSHPIPEPKSQEVELRLMKSKVGERKEPKRIKIEGTGYITLDRIYEEVWKDKHKLSVYRNDKGRYLYRSNDKKYPDWILNNSYDPKATHIYGWSKGKLLGTNEWNVVNKYTMKWEEIRVTITKVENV